MKGMVNILFWGFFATLSVQNVFGTFTISYSNKKYMVVTYGRTWGDARKVCQSQGLDLYVPTDAYEFRHVTQHVPAHLQYHAGGLLKECNGLQRNSCAILQYGGIRRSPCWATLPFVCGPKCYQTATAAPKTPKPTARPTPKTSSRWNWWITKVPKATTPKPTTKTPTTTTPEPTTLVPTTTTTTTTLKPTTRAPSTTTTLKPTTPAPSTTTTTTQKPTTIAPSTATSTTVITPTRTKGCGDKYPDCPGLGERVCQGLRGWAEDHCAQFCGFCKDKPCDDFLNCPKYGDTVCSSARLSTWVDKNCRKFCNRC